jgi:hypothetical protein
VAPTRVDVDVRRTRTGGPGAAPNHVALDRIGPEVDASQRKQVRERKPPRHRLRGRKQSLRPVPHNPHEVRPRRSTPEVQVE